MFFRKFVKLATRNVLNKPLKSNLLIFQPTLFRSAFSSKKEVLDVPEEKTTTLNEEFLSENNKDNVFSTREQKLSLKLLDLNTSKEILSYYEEVLAEGIKANDPLSSDESTLFLHFLGTFKENFSNNESFQILISNILNKCDTLTDPYLVSFIWGLGVYIYNFPLAISNEHAEKLALAIQNRMKFFPLNQLSSLTFAISRIFIDKKIGLNLMETCIQYALENKETLTSLDIINYLMIFLTNGINNSELVDKLAKYTLIIKNEASAEETVKIISALSQIGYKDKDVYTQLGESVIQLNLNLEEACTLLMAFSTTIPEAKQFIKSLMSIVKSEYRSVNITHYVNLWLASANYRLTDRNYEYVFNLLKKIPGDNQIWKIYELESYEIVNIIVAMSSLKRDDKEFLNLLIQLLEKKLNKLDNNDLINLARAFVVYVRQFEDFFIKIHEVCCERMESLEIEEKKLLSQTFQRVKMILADSPFVDNTV